MIGVAAGFMVVCQSTGFATAADAAAISAIVPDTSVRNFLVTLDFSSIAAVGRAAAHISQPGWKSPA